MQFRLHCLNVFSPSYRDLFGSMADTEGEMSDADIVDMLWTDNPHPDYFAFLRAKLPHSALAEDPFSAMAHLITFYCRDSTMWMRLGPIWPDRSTSR